MPGHKGKAFLGPESLDITEIDGADSLYRADGIIAQSEANASALFGCRTLYSTEGSSQCIRAMLYLAILHAKKQGKKPIIAAQRNAHKAFLSAAALLDFDPLWIYPDTASSYLSCNISPKSLDVLFKSTKSMPTALYLTSPDYLGSCSDIKGIAEVCKKYGVLLLVDNAHGAYLKFLEPSSHPIDLGADMCCDSAHKTLPVLTGGAYLHISAEADAVIGDRAKSALELFGSTSPSYLILQSLDMANAYLESYKEKLGAFLPHVALLKQELTQFGYALAGNEPLKLTVDAKKSGYTGTEIASLLLKNSIVCEFSDPDYTVLMLTPENDEADIAAAKNVLLSLQKKAPIPHPSPMPAQKKARLSVREAMLSPAESIPIEESCGRILASPSVGCPPAVPILICGEEIDEQDIELFRYYGIDKIDVVC